MTKLFASAGKRRLLACLLLVAATFAVYDRVSRNNFLAYDDDRYVWGNAHVRAGVRWSTIRWAFGSFEQANWHPLTWLSHAVDCQIFGLNPAGHHDVSLFLHSFNVLLLFLLWERLTGATARSFMLAAIFAIHPVNVESVAWIAERKNLLSMSFFLLSLLAYWWYVQKPSTRRYLAIVLLFACGLMSKPVVVTLPPVLLLLDYWPLRRMTLFSKAEDRSGIAVAAVRYRRSLAWLCREKLPLFALSAVSAIVTMEAQTRAGAVTVRNPFSFRLENALISYTLYMGKALWPVRLAALYPYPAQGWPWWKALVCFLLLASITAVVVKYRERRYLACGWFWYLGTMVPMIGLVQVGNQAMADRYAYLPFIGFFVMAIWAISDALGHSRAKPVLLVVSCIALAVLATISYRQVNYWRDDFSLWSHTLAVTQHNFVAEDNFGFALINRGRYQEGITHFRAAAQIEPGDPVSQVNLGIDAQRRGEWDEAMRRYQKALHLTSDSAVKASAYANLGSIQYALGDYQKARENLQSAIKLEASYPFVFLDLGMIAERAGDWNTAVDFYQKYVKGEPSDLGYLLLSRALDHIGQVQQAKLAYQQAERSSADIKQAEKTVRKLVGE